MPLGNDIVTLAVSESCTFPSHDFKNITNADDSRQFQPREISVSVRIRKVAEPELLDDQRESGGIRVSGQV